MRKIKILNINPSTSAPGSIEVTGDFTSIFQGRFYRDPITESTQPAYTDPAPVGSVLIAATTFDIIENTKYAGRYTVYTPVDNVDELSSIYVSPKTTIRVNEVVPVLGSGDASTLASDGYLINISTYLINLGVGNLVIPPGVDITTYPIEFLGRTMFGWGEVYNQNFTNIARNFAQGTAPANPFVGQTWFDTDDGQLRAYDGASWDLVNRASFGVTARHTQSVAATTWTVNHGLGLTAPYIGFVQFFVDRGAGPKMIIPSDVTFVSANQLTVSFSNAEIGYVLVRQ